MNVKNLSIGIKLPASFILLTFIVVSIIGYLGYRDFRNGLVHEAEAKLEILVNERSKSISMWFDGMQRQVASYGVDPHVVKAVQGLSATFGLLMEDPVADLQAAYIDDNPNPRGQRELLEQAETDAPYNYQHGAFHPYFREILETLGLYDVFLFDQNGNLIYSVKKETDFANNFVDGPYKQSGLGDAYRSAIETATGRVSFVDFASYAPNSGNAAAFMATPIVGSNGTPIGVFAIQLPVDQINEAVNSPVGLGATGEILLIADDKKARTTSRFDGRHDILSDLPFPPHIASSFDQGGGHFVDLAGLNGKTSISTIKDVRILNDTWHILAEFEASEIFAAAVAQRNKTILVSVIAVTIAGLAAWLVSRSLTTPVIAITGAMAKVSERNYDIADGRFDRLDELGDLSRALVKMSERSQEFDARVESEKKLAISQEFAVQELGTALRRLAKKDFSRVLEKPFAPEFEALREDFNVTLKNLNSTMSQLFQFSRMIEDQTQKMSNESSQLANRTENQAATLEETAAAVDQITGHIKSNSEDLKTAEGIVIEASDKASKGQKVLDRTSKAMIEIENSSSEIQKIIGVVDDIAFQTNLLALNAGVEAARAGEAGRGFAVVATEVQQLAQRATDSVSQISTLIENSGQAVAQGVELVSDTDAALADIVERIEAISGLIISVAANSNEQSDGLAEINIGVSQLDQATQQNAAMVEQSDNMAQQLKAEAFNLVTMLKGFELLSEYGNDASFLQNSDTTSDRAA